MNYKDQKPQSIYNFKPEDYITRVIPGRPASNILEGEHKFIGEKLKFKGILNGSIYLEKENDLSFDVFSMLFGAKENKKSSKIVIHIPLVIWEEGWAKYIEPEKELGVDSSSSSDMLTPDILNNDIESLKKEMNNAVENAEYEKAAVIKRRINDLKDKTNKKNNKDKKNNKK